MQPFLENFIFIASGSIVILKYSLLSVFFGFIIGVIISMLAFSNRSSFNKIAQFYVSIFRGTPLLIQLSLMYFGIPALLGIKISIFLAGVIGFSLNSGAYVSEIIKSGINSIDSGQFDAAISLGIPKNQMMVDIILPQVVKNITPSLVNELVNLVKETAVLSILGEEDIIRKANMISSKTYDVFTPMLMAGFVYYIIIFVLERLANFLKKKLAY